MKQKQCFRAVSDDSCSISTVQWSFHMRQHRYNAQPSDRKKKNWAVNRNRRECGASPSSPFMIGRPWHGHARPVWRTCNTSLRLVLQTGRGRLKEANRFLCIPSGRCRRHRRPLNEMNIVHCGQSVVSIGKGMGTIGRCRSRILETKERLAVTNL